MDDWITGFLEYTSPLPSPEIFRLWSGITAIAGALERRVWVRTAGGVAYPNLYVLLVGAPAVGKSQAIAPLRDMWRETKKLFVAPDSLTKAALLDELVASSRKIVLNGGSNILEYNSLQIGSSEFGNLVPSHDTEFLNVLNDIYDCRASFQESRRDKTRCVEIVNPQITIIAGTQPGYLANLLPEGAWTQGFMSRMIMIYASEAPQFDIFDFPDLETPLQKRLEKRMLDMTELMGQVQWEMPAQLELVRWFKGKLEPSPDHSKLAYYCGRRLVHILKLCIISAVSRTGGLTIGLTDLTRARDWLLHAEQFMGDVFREMVQRSDSDIVQELHHFMWALHTKTKKPIFDGTIINFLFNKMPNDRIPRLIEMASKAGIIARVAGTTNYYIPRHKHLHGVE